LCDRIAVFTYQKLRSLLAGISLVQVVHITGDEALKGALEAAPYVDAILLDSGNPDLPKRELGGTGRIHDWKISRRIREKVNVPVFLAGGLRPDNVAAAIQEVHPFGVDVCTGVRSDSVLDEAKLAAFFESVNSA
jgi:phosphoribosylanthranilate isomerase